ncbi:MAG: phage tail protein, partial [Azospirillum brasilense]
IIKLHKGFPRASWEKDPARNNEALDCRVYARAAASIYGLDRFSERQWQQLEVALGKSLPVAASPVAITQADHASLVAAPPAKSAPAITPRRVMRSDDPYL